MKKVFITGFIVAFCLLIIPLPGVIKKQNGSALAAAQEDTPIYINTSAPVYGENVIFRIKTENGIENIPADEYITGVVAAEMPVSYGIEALKAQCVAAYSFALYRKNARQGEEYDLTDSYKTDQSYLNEAARREKWGDTYEEKTAKIKEALSEVSGQYLCYGDSVALALYHALSSGMTNACSDVFGGDMPYLISVKSDADMLSPDYKSVFSFSADEIKTKLSPIKEASGEGDLFSEATVTESGFVKEIKYDGETVRGTRIAELLGLPCADFTVEFSSGTYTVTCLGKGHGVGMSQYGAGQLAETGSTYAEILAFYYPGTNIVKN